MQLQHLKELRLQGDLGLVIRPLHQLAYPRDMEKLTLSTFTTATLRASHKPSDRTFETTFNITTGLGTGLTFLSPLRTACSVRVPSYFTQVMQEGLTSLPQNK